MEHISSLFRQSRSGYNARHVRGGGRKMKTVRLGGSPQRAWRIKSSPKLKLKVILVSPFKLMKKLKNAYLNMMLTISGGGGDGSTFGDKRVPKARHVPIASSTSEFDRRLVLEIYKSLVVSRESAY